jgi:hypothetical protein
MGIPEGIDEIVLLKDLLVAVADEICFGSGNDFVLRVLLDDALTYE